MAMDICVDTSLCLVYRTFIMTRSKLPQSARKFLRKEKARIRRDVFDSEEQKKKITERIEKVFAAYGRARTIAQ